MLVCKAFYTSLALQFPPHNILNVMYCLSGGNKRKKKGMWERFSFSLIWFSHVDSLHCFKKGNSSLIIFQQRFLKRFGNCIPPTRILSNDLFPNFSILLFPNICPTFGIFEKIVVQSTLIMGWIEYLRKYMLKP